MCVFVSLRRSSSQISCVLIRLEPPPLPYTLYNAELYVEVVCFFPSTKCIIVEVDPSSRGVWDAEMFLAETFSNWQICVWQIKNPKLKRAEEQRASSVRMWSLLVFRRIQFCFAGFYMREQKSKNAFCFFPLFHCLLSSRLGFTAFPCTTWCYNRVTAPPLFFPTWRPVSGAARQQRWWRVNGSTRPFTYSVVWQGFPKQPGNATSCLCFCVGNAKCCCSFAGIISARNASMRSRGRAWRWETTLRSRRRESNVYLFVFWETGEERKHRRWIQMMERKTLKLVCLNRTDQTSLLWCHTGHWYPSWIRGRML